MKKNLIIGILSAALVMITSCAKPKEPENQKTTPATENSATATKPTTGPVTLIQSEGHFNEVLNSNQDRLLIFDFYADWCAPCKALSPLLQKIAEESQDRATVFKVDVMKHKAIAQKYKVSGIPHVVFTKNGKTVHSMTGLMPKEAYIKAINQYSTN